MPTNGQEVEMQETANQEQATQEAAAQEQAAQEEQANAEKEAQNKAPKGEDKKRHPMGIPHGGLRLEHEYQVLFGDNGSAQEAPAQEQSGTKDQAAQEKQNTAADMKIQLLEKEIALLKEQMAKVQAELQQLKSEKVQAAEPELPQELLDKLRELNGGKEVSSKVKENLNKILTDAKDSEAVLQQAMNEHKPGDPIYAGHYVPNIVAGKQITDVIKHADTPDVLSLLGEDGFPARWQEQMKMSPDVRFASDYFHDKEFFRQALFTKEGSEQIVKSVDNSFKKVVDAINAGKENPYETVNLASKIEAEKLAIEAGLVDQPETISAKEQKLLDHLRVLNGDKEVSEQVKNNLHQLLDESAKSRNALRQALDSRKPGEKLYAGDLVPSIVAGKNMENFIMDSTTPDILNVIGDKDFVSQWKKMSLLSTDVRFASDYMHDKEFFEQSIFTKNGMRQLSRSMDQGLEKWDERIQKGKDTEPLFTASKIEAEKLAIEAGLVDQPENTQQSKQDKQPEAIPTQEQKLLEHLRALNGNKEVPEQVKNNIHKLLTDGEKNRETLRENINAMKEGNRAWAGDTTVQSIVAAETLKRVIQNKGEPFVGYVGGMDNFMGLLGGKDFPKGWKELTGISENVRYAANFEHNKEFFKEHVLEEKGLRQLTDSVSDKFPAYLQKAAAKKDNEMHIQAQKGAFKQEYIAEQQAKAKPKQQPYKKPVVGSMQHNAPSIG